MGEIKIAMIHVRIYILVSVSLLCINSSVSRLLRLGHVKTFESSKGKSETVKIRTIIRSVTGPSRHKGNKGGQ